MTTKTRWLVFLVSTPLVVLIGVGGLLGAQTSSRQQSIPALRVFQDVVQLVLAAYVEEVDSDRVMDGAMRGLADSLDPSSAYLTVPEVKTLEANQPLPAGDVGIVVTRLFYLRILGVRDGSPAARANLRTGDFIRMIDGTPTRDMSALAGTRKLRGEPGSNVTLVVFRNSAADPHTVTLARELPKGDRVTSRPLTGGGAYVRVASFGPETAAELRKQIASLGAPANAGLVIDLRGTADGTPADGIQAARAFIKSGTIATRAGRDDKTVIDAEKGDGALTMPVVLLVSLGTAHAAEVFASALDDRDRADLVGEPTIGLAAEQRLVRLPQGHGLWMTHARYLRKDGKPIHEQGLDPDVTTDPVIVEFGEAAPAVDAPLDKAIERLKAKR